MTLGSAGGFGNGATFTIDKTGAASGVPDGLTINSSYDDPSKTFALTITKPYGYNDASLSGKAVPLKITAISEVDAQNNVKGRSPDSKDVWTIGPAALEIKGTKNFDVQNASIKITWKKLERANGYVVYRMRPKMTRNTDLNGNVLKDDYASFDRYYVNAAGTAVTPATATISLNPSDGTFTLTDNYVRAASNSSPALNQQYLALGIPFTYTVLPVMAQPASGEKEINYDISELEYPDDGDAYKNIATAQTEGYTVGYGIALEATKAEYSNAVVLNWELPKSAVEKGLWPHVYWRNKNSTGAWTRLNLSVNASTQSVSVVPNDRVQAREYAVTYGDSMDSSDSASKDAAYDSYQKTLFNKKITEEEPKCVGYMFTMPQIMPIKQDSTTESETEDVTWNLYDYAGNRAVGGSDITEYILELKNLNCSGTWWPLYTYDAAGKNAVKGNETWYDITLVTSVPAAGGKQVTVNVTPTFKNNSGKYHDGLLKVQRDYKHYYRIRAKRSNSQGDEIFGTSVDFAYRKITADEAKKCINLIIADAMHQAGVGTSTSVNTDAPTTCGNFTLIHKTGGGIFADGKCRITTGTGGYNHGFPATPGDQSNALVSAWNVTAASEYGGAIGSSVFTGTFIKNIPSTSITYSHETGLPSYAGSYTISGTCDGTEWFPYKFNDKDYSGPINSINANLPAYQGLWWEIRQGGYAE